MIAYLEDSDKAKKFQSDYDEDQYAYFVHEFLTGAYDNLAVHTAMQLGYNSPTVAGAVDDGIQVCRRTGNLEAIHGFREYATYVYQASGDYEMAEMYAKQNFGLLDSTKTEKRNFESLELLIALSMQQGKLQAALEYLDEIHPFVDIYHDPEYARKTLLLRAERLFWLAGKENEFADYLAAHGYKGMPTLPPREENGKVAWELTLTDAVKLARQNKFVEAANVLREFDQFLRARDVLNRWFDIRLARIACLLMAQAAGQAVDDNVARLKSELRDRANEAHHWSAISALDAIESGELPLNPLAIGFPIDIGPYAVPGTPVSHACLKQDSPFETGVRRRISPGDPSHGTASENDSPLIKKAYRQIERVNSVLMYRDQFNIRKDQAAHAGEDVSNMTFPQQREFGEVQDEVLAAALELTVESCPTLTPDELHAMSRPLFILENINTDEMIKKVWTWIASFDVMFKDSPRYMTTRALMAHQLHKNAVSMSLDPDLLGLPSEETTIKLITKTHKLVPQNITTALAAGVICNDNNRTQDALYYYSRVCHLERENDYATNELAHLYAKEDRPKDALAVIDLYCRAGGRNPVILHLALQLTISNGMPQTFLLYYPEFLRVEQTNVTLESWLIQALMTTSRFQEAIEALDRYDEAMGDVAVDRLLIRTVCLANLGQEWQETFETALAMIHKNEFKDCFFGKYYDLCGAVWNLISEALPESDERRMSYVQFLYKHGFIPRNF
ncbi:MAG: hypothetical protein Q4G59_09785, partial [Planctomycetia bacterium]|nr:hypothetical protein [Planctomycetia bacterium]